MTRPEGASPCPRSLPHHQYERRRALTTAPLAYQHFVSTSIQRPNDAKERERGADDGEGWRLGLVLAMGALILATVFNLRSH
jgi:hypothetical protein